MDGFCVSISEGAVTSILQKGYESGKIRDVLHGKVPIQLAGVEVNVTWKVIEAPSVSFADIDEKTEVIGKDGNPVQIKNSMFTIFAQMNLTVDDNPGSDLPLAIVADTYISGIDKASFEAVGLTVLSEYQSADVQIIKLLAGKILDAINTAFGFEPGKTPAALNLAYLREFGICSSKLGVLKQDNVMGVWGSAGDTPPVKPRRIPNGRGIALEVTNDMFARTVTALFVRYKDSCTYDEKDSVDLGITTGKYHLHAGAKGVHCTGISGDTFNLSVDPYASLEVACTTIVGDVGIDYDVVFIPKSVDAKAKIKIDGNTISGGVDTYGTFIVDIKPTGNVAEIVLSSILKAIAGALPMIIGTAVCHNITIPFEQKIKDGELDAGTFCSLKLKLADMLLTNDSDSQIIAANIVVDLEG